MKIMRKEVQNNNITDRNSDYRNTSFERVERIE